MRDLITRFVKNDDGASMVEYGLLVALIAVVAIPGVTAVGAQALALFNGVAGNL